MLLTPIAHNVEITELINIKVLTVNVVFIDASLLPIQPVDRANF